MMQSELVQPTWPLIYDISTAYSSLDPTELYSFPMELNMVDADYSEFSSSFSTHHDSSGGISMDTLFAAMTPDNLVDLSMFRGDKEILDSFSRKCIWMEESDSEGNVSSELTFERSADIWSPPEQNMSATVSTLNDMNLRLHGNNNVKSDSQLVLHHLLKAYGEAMETDEKLLMEVISKRVNEAIDPIGYPLERLAFNFFQSPENQSSYLRHQSIQNYDIAFKVFYEMFPYGRFAHFTANSSILEAIPKYTETIHIVDFDMGNGIQWPPMIEAIAQKGKALRFTSIKPDTEGSLLDWQFYETKQRLNNHARSLGLSLRIEEMSLGELTTEIKRTNKRSVRKDFLAFNCMVGLPHMCKRRNRTRATEFLEVAKELLAYVAIGKGIVTFGDGEAGEDPETGVEYSTYFNSQLMHYQALLESMECSDFPTYLREARLAMESLFVAPNICSDSWLDKWNQSRKDQGVTGFEGKRISEESLNEAKEFVNENDSSYKVNIHGEKGNQLVLEWKGTPLIQVSSWLSS